jgi:competence ComEA-like helix-hairpin-helix protein
MPMRRYALAVLPGLLWSAPAKWEEQVKYLADGPEKTVVARRCAGCHSAGNFTKLRKSEEGWAEVVADMVNRGAEIPDEDYEAMMPYLVRNYGPASKLNVNRAPLEELGKLLSLSKDAAKALVTYRDAHGPFREFADLLKVPGLDANKLASKRDLVVF